MRPRIKHSFLSSRTNLSQSQPNTIQNDQRGFTLIELLLIIAIVGTLVAVAVPNYVTILNKSRINQAIADIAVNGIKLSNYLIDYGSLPETLEEAGCNALHDPWGRPLQYLMILGKTKGEVKGKWRKDRFMVPINSDFDLYSCGLDGESVAPLTGKPSHDDIIRASNGDYIGLASKY